jgi:alpha-tubulin suppressor-like RCC1 family protein
MEKSTFNLVKQILRSPLFLAKTIQEQQAILDEILATGEITREELFKLITDEAARTKQTENNMETRAIAANLEKLDYDTFITFVMTGQIRGEKLLALCSGSEKLNGYCNRAFQTVTREGVLVGIPQDQYLFRILLDRMGIRIPSGKTPRQIYIERTIGGNLWVFGKNNMGQLGLGDDKWKTSPTLNKNLKNIVQASSGYDHSLCLDNQGRVWSFGENEFGKLGLGLKPLKDRRALIPELITDLADIIQISTGNSHSLCLNNQGRVWAFGDARFGQLGLGQFGQTIVNQQGYFDLNAKTNKDLPTIIPNLNNIVQISAGSNSSFFLDNQGKVWVCGENLFSRLGLGDSERRTVPTLIPNLENIVQVSVGKGNHALCLDHQGKVWAFGNNGNGQLGLGNNDQSRYPFPTLIPSLNNIVQVVAGVEHSFCLDDQGRVWTFGSGMVWRLGLGDYESRNIPTMIPSLDDIIRIDCGFYFSLCLDKQGRVWTFGTGNDGQLGTKTTTERIPTLIPNLNNIIDISCGNSSSFCIRKA